VARSARRAASSSATSSSRRPGESRSLREPRATRSSFSPAEIKISESNTVLEQRTRRMAEASSHLFPGSSRILRVLCAKEWFLPASPRRSRQRAAHHPLRRSAGRARRGRSPSTQAGNSVSMSAGLSATRLHQARAARSAMVGTSRAPQRDDADNRGIDRALPMSERQVAIRIPPPRCDALCGRGRHAGDPRSRPTGGSNAAQI